MFFLDIDFFSFPSICVEDEVPAQGFGSEFGNCNVNDQTEK